MIYYFKPYSIEKDLGRAYNLYMELLPNDNDWACFVDGDVAFLTPDYGHVIQEVVDKNQDVGLFTCYASRVGNPLQLYKGILSEDPNVLNHRRLALSLRDRYKNQLVKLNQPISGHLMIIKKSTWKRVGGFKEGKILGIDNNISQKMINRNLDVMLMKGVYIFHFYRLDTGRQDKSHLK